MKIAIPLLTAALGAALAAAQQTTFRANVNFVELDVSVLDGNRRPVTGLTAADFTVLEDGVPQKVETFEAIVLPEPAPPPAAWWASVPADVERNTEAGDGSLFVVVIDDESVHAMRIVRGKAIAHRLVDRMGPSDRMAIVYTRMNGRSQDFTSDKAVLRAAIERFRGGDQPEAEGIGPAYSSPGGPAAFEQVLAPPPTPCPGLVDALKEIARLTAPYQSRRKAAFVIADAVPALVPDTPCFYPLLELFTEAQRAHLNVYPIDPRGLQGFGDVTIETPAGMQASMAAIRAGAAGARTLAENTGGIAITQTNLFEENIERALVESRAYYILGYHSTNTSTDRKLRQISVTVAREDVTVRARSGYSVAPPTTAAPPDMPSELAAASRALIPATALHVDATVVPFRTADGTLLAIVAAARPAIADTAATVTEEVQAQAMLVDTHGDIKGTVTRRAGGRLTASPGRRAELRVPMSLTVWPGRYQVRVAAHSAATATAGSVFINVDVPDFARRGLSLSGVALGVAPDSAAMPLEALDGILPFVPSTRRAFRASDRVEAAVRVYVNGSAPAATAMCHITNDAGARVASVPAALSEDASGRSGALARCLVPLDRLPSGRHYLLDIDARAGGYTAIRKVKFSID